MDLYCIGEIVADFLPGEEEGTYIRSFGGAPANVAVAAARCGLGAGACCKVGDDDHGRFLEDTLKAEGVQLLCKERCRKAFTTLSFVTLKENGERSFAFARKPGADMFLSPEDVREDEINDSTIVHAGSCSLSAPMSAQATLKALKLGKSCGKITSFDINYRELMWDKKKCECTKAVKEILEYVDLLKISEEEADMLGGSAHLPEALSEYDLKAIVLTMGPAGARAYLNNAYNAHPDKEEIFFAEGKKAAAVDTTGAGDAFWGAFLSSLIIQGVKKRRDISPQVLKKALEFGNTSGALSVQKKGAISSLPSRAQIEAFPGSSGG